MTRPRAAIALLLILLSALGYFVWRQTGVRMGGTPAALQGTTATEEEWIVREVVEDVARMAIAASGTSVRELDVETDGAASDWRVRATAPGLETRLSLVPYFWAPDAYVDLARAFSPRTTAAPRDPERGFVRRLLSATTNDLVDEDLKAGAALAADPASVSAHEQAALLLAAIALRESSGDFSDLRPAFNRMTAHLAMAEALGNASEPSEAGRVARAALLVLTGRERDAEPWIGAIRDPAWQRLLRTRLTDDWRLYAELEPAARFEKLEWFRALARTLDTSTAMERYQRAFPGDELELDWYRIAVEQYEGPSDGYYFRGELLEQELEEIDRVRRRCGDTARALDLALDDPPRGLYGPEGKLPRVVGWNYWAGFYQRHLCDHLVKADTYYRIALGLPDDAEAYRAFADPRLQGMALHPFVRMRRTARAGVQVEDIDGFEDVVRATVRNPERINGANWYFASWTTAQMALRQGMPLPSDWFSPSLATASAFDGRRRLWHFGRHQSAADIAVLMELAPSSSQVWRLFVELPRTEPIPPGSIAELLRLMGPRADYDLHALGDVEVFAERHGQDERPIQERMCVIEPSSCVHLGELLADRSEDADAARAFRRAFDEASDRVHVSNHMKWLVRYYREHGNIREAMIVARDGADTGSSQGLTNLAGLLEDLDELDQAESLHRDNFERYENSAELIAFYYRLARVRRLGAYEGKLASAASELFPNGLKTYHAAENDTPPRDGALIDSNSKRLRESGLMPGDVVVALDGFRVRNFGQYDAVRAFTVSPELKLVVWRVNRYLDIAARSRDRRFGVGMIDYRPRRSIDSIAN